MKSKSLLLPLLLGVLLGCSANSHDVEGRWRATLVNQGTTIELGTLTIGADFIEIPYFDMRFNALRFSSRANETHFDRDKSASFSGADSDQQDGATGSIKRHSAQIAEMTLDRIQGVIRLTR